MQYNGLAKPKKQKIQLPSKFLMKHLHWFESVTTPIADVACGYGRNARVLADMGCIVHCLDKNADALAFLSGELGNLVRQHIDLTQSDWPFLPDSLGAVINVHYYQENLIDCFLNSLKPGGLLLIETIDARSGNYLQLPRKGFILALLQKEFEIITYQEKEIGVQGYNAVIVKVLAIKR